MSIHNILEEKVISRVEDLYADVQKMKAPWLTCACEQCKLDTTAYVLNKLPPKYVVSGRGIAHIVAEAKTQLSIDVDSLIIEGMKKIASTSRSFHAKKNENITVTPVFNFPTFNGTIYDGISFEPLKDAVIALKFNGELVEMIDHTWVNPYTLSKYTKGVYSFWAKPLSTKIENETTVFPFAISVKSEGYENTTYVFDLPLTSDVQAKNVLNMVNSFQIQDLYLFPPSNEEE